MTLLCITHHTLTVESWNENGVHVLDQDTQHVRLLLRDAKEVDDFIAALKDAQQSVQRTADTDTEEARSKAINYAETRRR
jgi:hypothetical protein